MGNAPIIRRFENKDYIIEFDTILNVYVTDKATGDKHQGMGAIAVELGKICDGRNTYDELRETIKTIWR